MAGGEEADDNAMTHQPEADHAGSNLIGIDALGDQRLQEGSMP